MKIYNENGKLSRTVVISLLQILSALILAVAEFVKSGDFSTYAILLFVNGVVMLVLRNLTDSALVE
jgi:hypothetical protein